MIAWLKKYWDVWVFLGVAFACGLLGGLSALGGLIWLVGGA